MPTEEIETVIIGGGQAGLVMSHMLRQRGRPHLVLERKRVAERWRSERWDGLHFQFPNWSVRLPGFPFPHTDPNGFAANNDILTYILAYADFVAPPLRTGVEVQSLQQSGSDGRFLLATSTGAIAARNVVVAAGPYQRPIMPSLLPHDSGVLQLHTNAYRAPEQLPPGAVLIVGSGASGTQIAEELLSAGRKVFICVSHHRRLPRRYRGRDLIWWLSELKLDQTPVEKRGPDRTLPLITGVQGGHTVDFRALAAKGLVLLGRAEQFSNGRLRIGSDLARHVADGDSTYTAFLDMVDDHVARTAQAFPEEPAARIRLPDPASLTSPISELDFAAAGIGSVLFATGFGYDLDWIDLPVLDARGEPLHRHGVTDVPGLYFLGLQWLSKMSSSFLSGVGDDAARLADHITARSKVPA